MPTAPKSKMCARCRSSLARSMMQTSLLNVSSNMQIADFDLPDAITNQQELDDIVNAH